MQEAKQNVAKSFSVIMRDPSTGFGAPLPGPTLGGLVVLIKKGGATSQVTITPTLTAVGSAGLLNIALTASHLDTLGVAAINITGPGVLPNDDLFIDVVAFDKNDGVRGGLSSLPSAAAGTSSGVALSSDVTTSTSTTATNIAAGTASATAAITASTNTTATNIVAGTTTVLAAIPSVSAVRDAILDAARSSHLLTGSIGEGVALATSLLQGNFYIDNIDNSNPNGPVAQRLRCFVDAAAMVGVTYGGSGEGEFATFVVATTYDGVNKVRDHKVTQQ